MSDEQEGETHEPQLAVIIDFAKERYDRHVERLRESTSKLVDAMIYLEEHAPHATEARARLRAEVRKCYLEFGRNFPGPC